jgi:hypothetical protein
MTRYLIAASLLSLAACTPVTPLDGPRGEKLTMIECHGIVRSFADCFQKANEVCPDGYRPAGSGGDVYPGSSGRIDSNEVAWKQAQRTSSVGMVVYRYLTIACN